MYFFIRTDLPLAQQSVQSIHACYKMVLNYRPDHECPNVVYIGVPDKRALEKVMRKLRDNQIPHVRFDEPDYDYGLTSVCTVPITGEQREVLSNYRLWNEQVLFPHSSRSECSSLQREMVDTAPPAGANFMENTDGTLT